MIETGIIYILGAGASNGALPIVDEIVERLRVFYFTLFIYNVLNPQQEDTNNKKTLERLEKFIKEIENRRSIDTYAKELFIKGDMSGLINLKVILGTYLIFEEMFSDNEIRSIIEKYIQKNHIDFQEDGTLSYASRHNINRIINDKLNNLDIDHFEKIKCLEYLYRQKKTNSDYKNNKTKIDQRYINFLIDIMEKDNDFPQRIKIFSWNYDGQFFQAIKKLNFSLPHNIKDSEYDFLKRLNGSAVGKEINPTLYGLSDINDCFDLFWRLNHPDNINRDFFLKFAFEQVDKNIEKNISSHIKDFNSVSDLIIVGYSFPISNRYVDKKIFEEILRKVNYTDKEIINLNIYLQVPRSDDTNDNYIVLKNKIIGILHSIRPELVLSADESELSHTNEIHHLFSVVTAFPTNQPEKSYSTIKIKFYDKFDPNNFYIPHSF